ncbi:MAG: S1 RNA-binding domain-containing protein, partial [Myxococcales bacterium]|nr:S1 RNA-binding domain-containing protein [Myxococcales bacterium]
SVSVEASAAERAEDPEAAPAEVAAEDSADEVAEEQTAEQTTATEADAVEAAADAEQTADETSEMDAAPAEDANEASEPVVEQPKAPPVVTDEQAAATIAADSGADECAPPQPGDILRGRVGAISESGHMILLNREIDRAAVRASIKQAREEKRRINGIVFGFNRGGFDVMVDGVRVFCPASFISLDPVSDPREYIGTRHDFTVAPPRKGKRKLVVDRRLILKREQRKHLKARIKSLEPGQVVTARVVEVREFGLFVDIGGVTGLVHQSELSWRRNVRPLDAAKVGDEIEVKVLEIERGVKGKKMRVSLSMKALESDPWEASAALLKVGSVQRGEVVKAAEVGAFVRLAPNIDGLLHISELGKDVKHAKQVLKVGDEIDVVVDRVDTKMRRISLSKLSKLERKAIDDGNFELPDGKRPLLKPGAHVAVLVDRVESAGIVVQVRGIAGRRGRGFIPNRELGAAAEKDDRRKSFAAGAEIEVKILQSDRDGGLRCSVRGLHMDEERRALRKYQRESKKKGFGTLGELFADKLTGR